MLLVVAVLPIENVVVVPGVGSLGRLAGLLLIVSAVPAFLGRGQVVARRQAVTLVLLGVYVLWAFAGLLWSVEPSSTLGYVFTFVQLLVLVVVIWQLCPDEQDRMSVQQAYVIGCALAVADALRNFLTGHEAVFQRFSITNTDPNDYALMLALSIPMAWDLFANRRGRGRLLNLAFIPVAIGAVVLSGSRGGAIAVAVAMLVVPLGFAALDRPGRRAVLGFLGLGALTLPFVWSEVSAAVGTNLDRIGTLGAELVSGTLNQRALIWSAGMDAFASRPLTGVGGGAFPAAIERVSGLRELAHNTFISVAVEMGAVGFLLFIGMILTIALPLIRAYGPRTTPGLVLLATLLVGIFPLTWEFRKPTWLVFSLLILLSGVPIGRRSEAAPDAPGPGPALSSARAKGSAEA